MKEEELDKDSATLNHFRAALSQFSFGSPDKNELRRSPRKPLPVRSSPAKRQASEDVKDAGASSRERSPKKQKRSYAPPETYAHLRELQDHLRQDLDVVELGSSPGKKSAEIGHHFGSPSNHFWWCLHHSGFTNTQLPPQEDFNLPDRFSLGLTNLVDRPTSEQMELSGQEQLAGVPLFLAKIARYRPRIVCFVGLAIAKVVESSLKLSAISVPSQRCLQTLSSDTKSWGLRPYKMVHPSDVPHSGSHLVPHPCRPDPSAFIETLFFAAPSTSGLVTQFQVGVFLEGCDSIWNRHSAQTKLGYSVNYGRS
ncbi:uracil-DNA glycosylase-like protein [Mycena vulgaris]|nr:uracil-DNA glycosylase-like protein [Mycena vulgaris]